MPFAMDNDAFSAWTKQREWDHTAWVRMLQQVKASGLTPRWILVPDVVTDRDATLKKWDKHRDEAAAWGWPLAFAVQDGMTTGDLPDAPVLFVGGSTDWKWESLEMWVKTGRRIHVGRVNEVDKLAYCEALGVESVDGTGWMRGTSEGRQARDLADWLEGARKAPYAPKRQSDPKPKSIQHAIAEALAGPEARQIIERLLRL